MKFQEIIMAINSGRVALLSDFPGSEFYLGTTLADPTTTTLVRKEGGSVTAFTELGEYLSVDHWSLKPEYTTLTKTVTIEDLKNAWDYVIVPKYKTAPAANNPNFKAFVSKLGYTNELVPIVP